MRIVAGDLRGRAIAAPKGEATRPTSDRARQAVFNILEHAPWAPELRAARVIDLFAGSGALGLEALSRGADFCLFVDSDAGARGAINENLETFGSSPVRRSRSATSPTLPTTTHARRSMPSTIPMATLPNYGAPSPRNRVTSSAGSSSPTR